MEPTRTMLRRCPDNPNYAPASILFQLEREEPGQHLAQFKWDGWRNQMYKENGVWTRHSKYDVGPQAKTPLPLSIIQQLDALALPDGTAFDSEWMGKRSVHLTGGRQWLVLFDLLYLNGQWLGRLPFEQRHESLKTLFVTSKMACLTPTPDIEFAPIVDKDFYAMFELSKTMPLTEGIVVKGRNSLLHGKLTACEKNGQWQKIKWRDLPAK